MATIALTGSPSPLVEHAIAVSEMVLGVQRRWRQRFGGRFAASLEVQTLISKIRKDTGPARHQPRGAAIFMHSGAGIEGGGRDINGGAVGTGMHDHVTALLPRPPFEPVAVISGEPHLRQHRGLLDDEVRCDR